MKISTASTKLQQEIHTDQVRLRFVQAARSAQWAFPPPDERSGNRSISASAEPIPP